MPTAGAGERKLSRAAAGMAVDAKYRSLFRPLRLKNLSLPNRVVMAPIARSLSPGGVPGPDAVAYYRRRAKGKVGLIITEATYVATPSAGPERTVPRLSGPESEAAWRRVVEAVHGVGGRIFAQLWHVGMFPQTSAATDPDVRLLGPSGLTGKGEKLGEPMTDSEIAEVIAAFAESAAIAQRAGFDGVELHGAHGYLIDQFFWSRTNQRTDGYGGDLVDRTRFTAEVITACRRRVGASFPVGLRLSQWKIQDLTAVLVTSPVELECFLRPLVDAGIDIIHCSQRRHWEPEFPGSDLNFAGWAKKLTGLPTITVGAVSLDSDFRDVAHDVACPQNMDRLVEKLERGDFDLVAVGRAILANPNWPEIVKAGDFGRLAAYDKAAHETRLS